jgi:hypothetical protein
VEVVLNKICNFIEILFLDLVWNLKKMSELMEEVDEVVKEVENGCSLNQFHSSSGNSVFYRSRYFCLKICCRSSMFSNIHFVLLRSERTDLTLLL